MILDLAIAALLFGGLFFFAAGSVGLLRFPDAASRLHALTKADNVGLALVALAAGLAWGSVLVAAKVALVWVFALVASGAVAQLLGRIALDDAKDEERAP